MYIEQKTAGNRILQDRGPAEIGEVSFSKTGRTIYYQGKSFRRIEGGGVCGNYVCLEDGNEYWITGVKKRGSNRHWAGSGPVVDTTTPSARPKPGEDAQDKAQWFDAIRSELKTAALDVLGTIHREHPGLKLRCFLFEIYEQQAEVRGRVVSDEGFVHRTAEDGAARYRVEADDVVMNLSVYLRWGGWDRSYEEPEPAFREVNDLLRRARGYGIIKPFDGSLKQLCVDALRQLDAACAFATREYRAEVVIGISDSTGFDTEKEFLAWAKQVNPPPAIQRFRRELRRAKQG
jgi:hypothetical protein